MRFSAVAATLFATASLVAGAKNRLEKRDAITFSSTPSSFTSCQNSTISWEAVNEPYMIVIYCPDGGLWGQITQNDTSYDWTSLAADGKQVGMQLYDSQGNTASVDPVPAVAGSDTSCVVCPSYLGVDSC
ncbi:hypothetical protein DL93DRAFT_2086129 [Clavulina sp. PMI_390]|nr:hypothetical protein DL93DRAFT_2086129 [Clavulina sp. PMI_390]